MAVGISRSPRASEGSAFLEDQPDAGDTIDVDARPTSRASESPCLNSDLCVCKGCQTFEPEGDPVGIFDVLGGLMEQILNYEEGDGDCIADVTGAVPCLPDCVYCKNVTWKSLELESDGPEEEGGFDKWCPAVALDDDDDFLNNI